MALLRPVVVVAVNPEAVDEQAVLVAAAAARAAVLQAAVQLQEAVLSMLAVLVAALVLVPHLVAAGVRQVPVEQVRQTYLAMAETGLLIH
jgi:hypothetical protein